MSILPGDIKLSLFESELQDFWIDCRSRKMRGFRGVTALRRLVTSCVHQGLYDFVFYDTGPTSALNKAILLDCDYFIVPAAPDLFSIRALGTLGRSTRPMDEGLAMDTLDFAPVDIEILPGSPSTSVLYPNDSRCPGRRMLKQNS